MNKKLCIICMKPVHGRADKKFCSEGCRYEHNNLTKKQDRSLVSTINSALRQNRDILHGLSPDGTIVVKKEEVLQKGYQFDYFTSIYITRERQIYYLCYDMGFTPLTEDGVQKLLIVHRQSFVKDFDPWKVRS